MTLEDFVAELRAGTMRVPGAADDGATQGTRERILTPGDDLDDLTAEAIGRVVDLPISWDDAKAALKKALDA
jgi:hypothetical protein